MGILTVTNPVLSNPANRTEVQQNFTDVTNWANGSISNGNIDPTASIAVTKLAASVQEHFIHLIFHNGIQGLWPAAGATTPLIAVPVPGTLGDDAWIATDVSWVCTDTGTAAGSFDVRVGFFNAGAWTNEIAVVTGISMPVVGAGNLGNQGKALEDGQVTIGFATYARSIALMSAGIGTGVITGTADYLQVAVRLRRSLQIT
jgi:hypothetical protein